MRRGIYALVRSILLIIESGPAVALSAAIIWLFFATSCGLLVAGETDGPLLNALPVIFAGIAGLLLITALVKYLRRGHGRFHQVLSDGTILVALRHQAPGAISARPGIAHILPLAVFPASGGYGEASKSAAGKVVCPECQQEATFLINDLKTTHVPGWSKLLLGLIFLIPALALNISLSPLMWPAAPGWTAWIRFCSWIILLLSMLCFVSLLRSIKVRRLSIPSDHLLSRLTSTDAKNFRQHESTIQQFIRVE